MNSKKVIIGNRPSTKSKISETEDDWVKNTQQPDKKERMKRLTVDIPESIHRKLKADCAIKGNKISDEIRGMLSEKYCSQS